MKSPMRSVLFLQAVLPSLFFQATAAADCDCGYTTDVGTGSTLSKVLFTEAFETDFRHVADLKPSEWRPQTYNKTAEQSHGRYGRMYSNSSTVPVTEGSEPGLELDVRSQVVDDMVLSGEVAAKRKDFYHGTYRTSVKLSSEVGTCAAFYWYFSDTQEIDMEFLSKDFHAENNSYPVNIVLHSQASVATGFDAVKAGTWTVAYLPFDPTNGFHEYRFDFLPGVVYFYADGKYLTQMSGAAVPTDGGKLLLAHWSNGKPTWTGGPPKKDSAMKVEYVKSYFNSSETAQQDAWQKRCPDFSKGQTCAIPSTDGRETFFNLTSVNGGAAVTEAQAAKDKKNSGFKLSASSLAVLLPMGMVSGLLMSL